VFTWKIFGENMKKIKNSILLAILLSILIAIPMLALPASAKNLNVPDAVLIDYYNAGGQANVNLQTALPAFPAPATVMQFRFIHCEIPNSDVSFDNLLVFLGFPIKDATTGAVIGTNYQPYAGITTSPDYATFGRAFWYGTYMQFDATLYGLPASRSTSTIERNNIIVVDKDVLTVDRHGNDVTVTLKNLQTIYNPIYGLAKPIAPPSFTIPAFSLELSNYGGATHYTGSATMGEPTPYKGASGMTIVHEEMRFNVNAILTSSGSLFDGATVTDSFLMMNGMHTFYPKAS
jgi:hypothetical protein